MADELGATHCTELADITAASEVVITVVTNDTAMREIFAGEGDNLLIEGRGKGLYQLCHHYA